MMNNAYSKDPKQAMADYLTTLRDDVKKTILSQHLKALRSYLRKAFVERNELTSEENMDRRVRMREFLAIGKSYGLTDKQLVAHLFKGLFNNSQERDGADCATA